MKKVKEVLKCDKCDLSTTNKGSFISHKKSCDVVNDNLETILSDYKGGVSMREIVKLYKISFTLFKRILNKYGIKHRKHSEAQIDQTGHKQSIETRKKISEARKKFLRENPDKHNWKNNDKFISLPCETLKKKLTDNNINFIEEYSPSLERHFSIDISFPDSKVGIEVNGNQHYNRDGSLKDYYKERSDFIEGLGWELIELPYIMVYNDDVVDNLIKMVSDKSISIERCEEIISERNLEIKIKKELKKITKERKKIKPKIIKQSNKCIDCNTEVTKNSKRCSKCNKLNQRKVDRPPLNQLLKEIEETSYLAVGRKYGVSYNAIRKWIKQYQK